MASMRIVHVYAKVGLFTVAPSRPMPCVIRNCSWGNIIAYSRTRYECMLAIPGTTLYAILGHIDGLVKHIKISRMEWYVCDIGIAGTICGTNDTISIKKTFIDCFWHSVKHINITHRPTECADKKTNIWVKYNMTHQWWNHRFCGTIVAKIAISLLYNYCSMSPEPLIQETVACENLTW